MRELRRYIPSGNLLYVFDAAARHESFAKAAEELSVTPAAVSHAIRQMEAALGVSLFERGHRKLRISEAGAKLFQSVAVGLDRIEQAAKDIQTMHAPQIIKLYASITIATYCLLPQLAALRDQEEHMELRLYNSDRTLDLPADGVSIAITGGKTDWPGYDVSLFARELIYPICSPAYLERHGAIPDVDGLRGQALLHLDENHHDGVTWFDFLEHFGVPIDKRRQRLVYNNYILVLHAAIAGEGIALGWHHAVGDLVARGELVRPVAAEITAGNDFYVVARKGRKLDQRAGALRDWLVRRGAGASTPPSPAG
jgi:DNA-binding transcriptional LysR family regulator